MCTAHGSKRHWPIGGLRRYRGSYRLAAKTANGMPLNFPIQTGPTLCTFMRASVPIPKLAHRRGPCQCEPRNQRDARQVHSSSVAFGVAFGVVFRFDVALRDCRRDGGASIHHTSRAADLTRHAAGKSASSLHRRPPQQADRRRRLRERLRSRLTYEAPRGERPGTVHPCAQGFGLPCRGRLNTRAHSDRLERRGVVMAARLMVALPYLLVAIVLAYAANQILY